MQSIQSVLPTPIEPEADPSEAKPELGHVRRMENDERFVFTAEEVIKLIKLIN